MLLRDWNDLPDRMKNESVRSYYEILERKKKSLIIKRIFDIVVGLILLIVLSPLLITIGLIIKIDSGVPVFFRQTRVTQYGKNFKIFKFRTMVNDAEHISTAITTNNDPRVTRTGKFLRRYKLDEIPQLFNIVLGDISFVGTRPEVPKYVEHYTDEMMATLLLPAGVTSEASIKYKDEEKILTSVDDVDKTYIDIVLPEKMKHNITSIGSFSFFGEIKIMARTIVAVISQKNDFPTKN